MRVEKWGDSLAVRLPKEVVDSLKLKEGDEIEVTVTQTRRLEVSDDRRREEAIERLRKLRARLPAGYKFDREEANRRR